MVAAANAVDAAAVDAAAVDDTAVAAADDDSHGIAARTATNRTHVA